jgi:hypothetical protein
MQNASIYKFFIAITVFSGCSDGTPAPRSGVKYGCVTGSAKGTACSDNSKGDQKGNPPKEAPPETSNTQAGANPQAANQAGMLPAGQNQPTGNALQQLGQQAGQQILNQAATQAGNFLGNTIGGLIGGNAGSATVTFSTKQATFLKKTSGMTVTGNSSVTEGMDYCKISGTVTAACTKLSGSEYFAKGVQGCSGLTFGFIHAEHVTLTKGSSSDTCQ